MRDITPLPAGDYCIVELFGHVTLVGRYKEVEQFGTKMMAIEPLFQDMTAASRVPWRRRDLSVDAMRTRDST